MDARYDGASLRGAPLALAALLFTACSDVNPAGPEATGATPEVPGPSLIVNGVLDEAGHPNVGFLAIEFAGGAFRVPLCSGFFAGPHLSDPTEKVFITAAHCLAELADFGIAANQLVVTFDALAHVDPNACQIVCASDWFRATAFAFDPRFPDPVPQHGRVAQRIPFDFGAVILQDVPAGLVPVELPTAGLLDQLAAQGGLRPHTVFDNVGYGRIPFLKDGPPGRRPPGGGGATNEGLTDAPGRMFSTSLFKGLTSHFLMLNQNVNAEDGNGGGCFGDSGSPKLVHDTNLAVAINGGGDPLCRANSINPRLDTPEARAFYGHFLALP